MIAVFIQFYCENARYLHRIYRWVAQMRLDWCKAAVFDDLAGHRALYERFMLSQTIYQVDPRAELARPERQAELQPMAALSMQAAE